MKLIIISCILIIISTVSATAQHPVIGGYNVYFGDLHNHSNVSDGTGSPETAYSYAKNTAHLDFFGLTDHSNNSGSISSAEWTDIKNQANAYNEDGLFTAFYGFEWSADPTYGHISVINTDDYCTTFSPTDTFESLVLWLASRPDGFAYFNHPAKEYNTNEFSHFITVPSDQLVGIELFNNGDGFTTYYYNDGFYAGDNNKSYYDEANSRGWKLGALGSGDNHSGTWGTAYPYRMAILAGNLNRSDLLEAIRARRFYATLDKNLSLSFKINGMEMGSTIPGSTYTLQVLAQDGDNEIFNQVMLYNQNHSVVNTWSLNTNSVNVSMTLPASDGEYYYIKIRESDGDEAISSPIWINGSIENQYPLCSITSPPNGATFVTPADINISATAIDPDGSITNIEFYQGNTKLGEDLTAPYSLTWTGVTTGTYSLRVKATDNKGAVSTSSAVSVTVGGIPITVTADVKTKVYGSADPQLTYRITSGSLAGSDTFTGSLSRDAGENSGTYTIRRGTLSLDSKYILTFIESALTISPRSVTVTADHRSKVYGNNEPALTYTITSGTLVGSDTFSGSLRREEGENAGSYDILRGTLTLGSNYNLGFISADFVITTRPVTVAANNITKIYGDEDNLTYRITAGSLVGSDIFSGELSREEGEDVGIYDITRGSLRLSANYIMTFMGAELEIITRHITVTADNKSKSYGDPDNLTFRITSGSLAPGDAFSGSLLRDPGENIGIYPINRGTLALGPNYLFTFVGANLSITARAITVTAASVSKVYGDSDHLSYSITEGSLAGSDLFSGNIIRDPGENTGHYTIRQGTLALNSNYLLTFIGSELLINPRPVGITADSRTKVYGEPDPELTYRITSGNLVEGDAFSGNLTRNPGENAGSYLINKGTLALGANYLLSFTSANFVITRRPVTVSADQQGKVYGESDPELTYKITSGTLAGNGDTFSGSLSRESGEDAGIYKIKQGTLALNSNYILTCIEADFYISMAEITVNADNKSKIYGDDDPELTFNIVSGSLQSGDTFEGELLREQGEDAGIYSINQGSLILPGNYILVFNSDDLEILPRPVSVKADSRKKVHGEPDPELTFQIDETSLIGEDSFTGSLTRDKGEDVGTYRITLGTLTLGENYILDFEGADFIIAGEYTIKTFPNPFSDHISFEVELNYSSDITLEIYDASGKKIATVFSGKVEPDLHRFDYGPKNSARGLLIYKFIINGHVMKGKIICI